ncbi:hypothetical protein PAMA_017999 [Pampus argenteus]
MKHQTGFLKLGCVWIIILIQSLQAAPKKHAITASSCRPKELTALIKREVEESLASFNKANGNHLGTWSPGFPMLQVHQNFSQHWGKVQCSLIFMAQGLERLLEDQMNNLNPTDFSLHQNLRDSISSVNMLTACVKSIHGGECSPKPSPPKLPVYAFERKKWGHTLLVASRNYLGALQHHFSVQISKIRLVTRAKFQKYLGITHLL